MSTTYAREPQSEVLSIEERVRRRAYEFYVERGELPDKAPEDWLRAEDEIRVAEEDAFLDGASEDSFPGSDPPAH